MGFSSNIFSRDIAFALCVAGLAGYLTLSTYSHLEREKANLHAGVVEVPTNPQRFVVSSAGGCAGDLTIAATEEDSLTVLRLEGSVDLALPDRLEHFTLVGRIFFNPLGQMGLGYVAIESATWRLAIDAKDVSPIQVTARVESKNQSTDAWQVQREQGLVIPGPLEIKRISAATYRLSYPLLATRVAALPEINPDAFGITVEEEPSTEYCRERTPLPVLAIIQSMRQAFPQLAGL